MKFIHISDIHIGMNPDPTTFWSDDRAEDIKESFIDVIKMCKEENLDFLLISGNLFNHQPLTEELNFVNDLFKTIENTKVLIVAGSFDHIKANSPILNYKFADNVYYFTSNSEETVAIKNTNVVVHGFSYFSPEEPLPIIDSITPEDDKKIHILLACAGDSRHVPIDLNKLEKKNFAYVALGSRHNFETVVENKIYYSGSLEPLNQNDLGDHGIIMADITESSRKVRNLKFIKMAKASYIPIKIKINGNTDEEEIVSTVTRDVLKNGANNIYIVELQGLRNPDYEFTKDMFNKKIRIIDFIDNTDPKYDFIKLSSEHPQDMIGAFIRKMTSRNSELSEIEKKALYLGTQALIKTSESDEG